MIKIILVHKHGCLSDMFVTPVPEIKLNRWSTHLCIPHQLGDPTLVKLLVLTHHIAGTHSGLLMI